VVEAAQHRERELNCQQAEISLNKIVEEVKRKWEGKSDKNAKKGKFLGAQSKAPRFEDNLPYCDKCKKKHGLVVKLQYIHVISAGKRAVWREIAHLRAVYVLDVERGAYPT